MPIAAYLAAKDFLGSPIVGIDRAPEYIDQRALAATVTETINVPANASFAVIKLHGSGVVYVKANSAATPPTGDVGDGTAWDMLKTGKSLRYVLRDFTGSTPITTLAFHALTGTPIVTIAWYYRERQGQELSFPSSDVFDLNLMTDTLPAGLTFSRASIATDVVAGNLVQYASGVPRISSFNGLLMEEGRTNSLRNGQAEGATVGVIGSGGALPTNWGVNVAAGLTTEVLATGTRNGFNFVRIKISGTPSSSPYSINFEGATQITAATAETWTGSFYAALVGGSLANVSAITSRIQELTAAGANLIDTAGSDISANLTSSLRRFNQIRTLTDATTGRVRNGFRLALSVGLAVDLTVELAAPQLELGAFATSYIPTTSAAVARAVDLCTATPATINNCRSVYAEFMVITDRDSAAASGQRPWQIDDGTGSNRHTLNVGIATGNITGGTIVGGVSQASMGTGVIAAPVNTYRSVYAFDTNSFNAYCNGLSGTLDTAGTLPTVNRLVIGSASDANISRMCGYVRVLKGYSVRLTDAQALSLAVA